MKHFMLRSLILLSLLCSTLGVNSVWAQLAHGKVYNFANVGQTGKSLVIESDTKLIVATTDAADTKQQWYAEEVSTGVFALRNMYNGKYLKSPNATPNKNWTTVLEIEDNCKLVCEAKGSNYTFRATNTSDDYHYLHYSSAQYVEKVVCWQTSSTSSQWTFTEVAYEADILGKMLQDFDIKVPSKIAQIQTNLKAIFEDDACTKVKSTFTSEAAIETSDAYKALPDALRNMVKKVYNQSWTENNYDSNKNPWDAEYAKKYRVQWYEPYTEPECAASALRINAHSNLNNPTGIFANSGDVLFVMVEGEIKEGAYLYLAKYTGHNKLGGYKDGVQLQSGLNVIPVTEDGSNYCINYVVQTFDTSKGTGKKAIIQDRELSKYPDLQIHIEGGYINGYWNKMGDNASHNGDFNYPADTDNDWDYIKARATQTDVTVLGEYVTLQFPLTDEGTGDDKGMGTFFNSYGGKTTSLEASIEEWDNVMIWERLLMGVLGKDVIAKEDKKSPYSNQPKVTAYTGDDGDDFGCDYSEYYRVHGLSFGTEGNYMYGGWDHCGYNFNTMESIMLSIVDEAGPHWGPAHEIGHQHQGPLNMRGLTEVTNNLFSNVVLWYFGKSTSRYNGTDGSLSNVLQQFNADGTDFFSNNIWAQTIMYYKLFLYYHVLGNNPKFYPRLFEMLRQNPMAIEYNQDGGKCLMHFYKLCCDAAGEDLTEFFRAHGFFRVMEDRFVGDYSNAVYNMTQAQIDAAIAEVKAKKYSENIAVLFITDATGEGNIKSNRGDDVCLTHFDTNNSVNLISGELGNYATFNNTVPTPSYNYAISGNTVTMEGSGGVGFAILNEKGELIGFSDKKIFEISAEAAAAIASGKASVVTLKADNTPVAATNVMDTGNTEEKYELLGELLGSAKQLFDLSDATGTKVGYYRASSLTKLQEAYGSAKAVYDAQTIAAYSAVYDVLYQEYANLLNNEYARINIIEGNAYRLTNKAYSDRSMGVATADGDDKNEMFGLPTANDDAQLWYFEAGATPATYYIKNKATGLYSGDVSTGAVLKADKSDKTTDNGAHAYRLQNMGNGVFALVGKTGLHCSASQSYNIVGWGADADATQWYITAEGVDETHEARLKLEELVGKAEALINEVGTVEEQGVEPITLTADAYYCNARCINTQSDQFSSYSVLNDGNIDTYLHTDYSGADSEDGYAHYIRMDVGESSKIQMFKINYTTRNYMYPTAPKSITIEGSNDLTTWEPIETNFTEGLPTNKGTAFTTPTFGNGIKYRYIRLVVNNTITNQEAGPEGNKHRYFALSELGISKVNYTTALNATYNTINSNLLSDLYSGMLEANGTLATSSQADVLNAAYTNLTELYTDLSVAKAKAELRAKIAQLAELIAACRIEETGSVRQESACNVSDAESGKNGNEYYLLVDAGEGETLKNFYFSYQTQTDESLFPYKIEVYGSENNSVFTDLLATFTTNGENALPSTAGASWTSGDINSESYRYLRFNVTVVGKSLPVDGDKDLDTSNGGAQLSNKYKKTLTSESTENISGDFSSVMSNFRLTKIVDVEKTYVYYKGDVTENQWNNATTVNNNATTLANGSWDSAELNSTKDNLQDIYDKLLEASRYITVNLTPTSKDRDTLLKGIDDGQTIGTFSAPWATIVPEGVTAYYAKQKYDGEGGTVWLTPIEEGKALPANQGVILIGDVGVNSVKFELAEEVEEVADLSENAFSNSAKGPVVMEGNDYILAKVDGQGIGFFNAKPDSQLNQRKAFFRLPAGVNTLKLVMKFGGNTTDIDSTVTDALSTDDVRYDIYGRRVIEVKKGGIYIKNGKKFFVK